MPERAMEADGNAAKWKKRAERARRARDDYRTMAAEGRAALERIAGNEGADADTARAALTAMEAVAPGRWRDASKGDTE